jgi:hypothetical protein
MTRDKDRHGGINRYSIEFFVAKAPKRQRILTHFYISCFVLEERNLTLK